MIVNDVRVSDYSLTAEDGSHMIIRAVPGKDAVDAVGDAANDVGDAVSDAGQAVADGTKRFFSDMGDFFANFGAIIAMPFQILGKLVWNSWSGWLEGQLPDYEYDPGSNDRLPSIRGSRNRPRPWGPVPVLLGRHYIAPPPATQPYTELVGEDQYQRLLFVLGYGPMEIQDIRIGETPLSTFDGVTTQERITAAELATPTTIVPSVVNEEQVGLILEDTPVERTTSLGTSEISVDIEFPRGIVEFDDEGKRQNRTVSVRVQYRPRSGGSWSTVKTWTVTAKDTRQIRRGHVFSPTGDPDGQYDVRVERTTGVSTDNKVTDDVYWSTLRSITTDDPLNDDLSQWVSRYAMRIRATDQLSGVVSQLNMIGHSVVPDYDGSGTGAGAWSERASSNPASLYLYLLRGRPAANGRPAARPVGDAEIDWPAFEDWHEYCETQSLEYNDYIQRRDPVSTLAKAVALVGHAQPTRRDGKYSIVVDKPRPTPVQMFTPRNSWGFSAARQFADPVHCLKMQFVNADNGYQPDECYVYDDGYSAANATEYETLRTKGITHYAQAWKHGRRLIANRRLRREVYSLTVDIEHAVSTRGDLVLVQHDVMLVGITSGRVKAVLEDGAGDATGVEIDEQVTPPSGETSAVRFRTGPAATVVRDVTDAVDTPTTTLTFATPIPAGSAPEPGDLFAFGISGKEVGEYVITAIEMQDDMSASLTLVDYAPGVYDASSGTIPPFDSNVTPPSEIPSAPPAPTVTAVWSDDTAAVVAPDGTINQHMMVSWSLSESGFDVDHIQISWRITDSDVGWKHADVDGSETSYGIPDVIQGEEYTIRLRAVTTENVAGSYATTTHIVQGSDGSIIPPTIPTYGDNEDGTINGNPIPLIKPVIAVSATQRSVAVSVSKQPDLTASSLVYDLQISKDQTTWYPLGPGGTGSDDWRGATAGDYTVSPNESRSHESLPFEGDAAVPTDTTYYYRARLRTNATTGPWSDPASVTISPLIEVDFGAGVITAPKLHVDSVTAEKLLADTATIDKLFSTTANIEALFAKTATIDEIQAIELSADRITTGTLDAARIGAETITTGKIAAGAITSPLINATALNWPEDAIAYWPFDDHTVPTTNGLIHYWKLNGNTDDEVGGKSLSLQGGASYTNTAVAGQAIDCDGSDDYLSVSQVTLSGEFTLSGWYYLRPHTYNWHGLWSDNSGLNRFLAKDSGFYLEINDRTTSFPSDNLPNGYDHWYHIVLSRRSDNIFELFINGQKISESNDAISADFPITHIGQQGSYDLNGIIDELRIYSRSLSDTEVQQLYEYGTKSLGIDANGDPVIVNVSDVKNGNNGTLSGSPQFVDGPGGGALEFDGVDDYVNAGDVGFKGQSFTTVLWFKLDSLPGTTRQTLLKYTGASWSPGIWLDNSVIRCHAQKSSGGIYDDYSWTPDTGVWHQVGYTYNDSTETIDVYFDGQLVTTTTTTYSDSTGSGTLYIGDEGANTVYSFQGTIAEPRIYNRALSAAEVKTLFQFKRPGSGLVRADQIQAGSITADKLEVSDIQANVVQTATLSADQITAGTLDAARIGVGTLTGDKLVANTIKAEQVDVGDLLAQNTSISGTLTVASGGSVTSSGYTLDDSGITAVAGDIGSWLINIDHLRSAAAGSKRIDLNAVDNRVEVWASGEAEPKNAMGYVGGLSDPSNRSNTLSSDVFGFWSSQGNKIQFLGDADLLNGQWTLQQDASMDIVDTDGDALLRFGTHSGGKGLFYWSNPTTTPGDTVLTGSISGSSDGWVIKSLNNTAFLIGSTAIATIDVSDGPNPAVGIGTEVPEGALHIAADFGAGFITGNDRRHLLLESLNSSGTPAIDFRNSSGGMMLYRAGTVGAGSQGSKAKLVIGPNDGSAYPAALSVYENGVIITSGFLQVGSAASASTTYASGDVAIGNAVRVGLNNVIELKEISGGSALNTTASGDDLVLSIAGVTTLKVDSSGANVTGNLTASSSIFEGGSKLSDKYAAVSHSHSWSQITSKPSTFPPSSHDHTTITPNHISFDNQEGGDFTTDGDLYFDHSEGLYLYRTLQAGNLHTGNDAYLVLSADNISAGSGISITGGKGKDNGPITFSLSPHTHDWADITGEPAYTTRWPTWSEVTSKPTTLPPPIGAGYIQFPGFSSPETLWPGTDWTLVTFDTYGAFFRTEGSNAKAFNGGVQGWAIQSHNHSLSNNTKVMRYTGGSSGDPGGRFDSFTMSVGNTGSNETRPRNETIRVWRRDA
ncbi:MAG: host specificity factor TipJ family phage tail protein [Alkalispirochaeta sp.]